MNQSIVRFLGVLAVFGLGAGACSSAPGTSRERVGQQASALQASVTKAFDVDKAPALAFSGTATNVALTCADSVCFVAWKQCISDYQYSSCALYGERLNASGTLDAHPIYIAAIDSYAPVASDPGADVGTNNQGEFVVLWTGVDQTPRFSRISAADGSVLQAPTVAPARGSIASNGTSYVVSSYLLGQCFTIKNGAASGLVNIGGATAQQYNGISVIPGPNNQYLFAWSDGGNGRAARFDAGTGAFLDASGFIYTKHSSTTPKGVYAGGVYVLAWNALKLLRINPNGTVIDADDDFNNVSTAKSFAVGTSSGVSGPEESYLFKKDDQAFYVWRDFNTSGTRGLKGVHIDPANAALVAGDPIVSLGSKVQPPWTMALGANGGYVLNAQLGAGAVPLAWASAPFGLTAGAPVPFTMSAANKQAPAVGSDGANYLVTWTTGTTLWGARLSPTGALLDTAPFAITTALGTLLNAAPAAITFDGTDYLVSWSTGSKIFGRTVHTDGSLGAAPTTAFYTNNTQLPSNLRGFFNGKYHWLAWKQYYPFSSTTFEIALARVDPSTLTASTAVESIIYDGAGFTLTGDTTPDAAHRTVFVSGREKLNNIESYINSQRIRSESMIPQDQLQIESHLQNPSLFSASDGTNFMMAWDTDQLTTRGALIDPVAGTALTGFPKAIGAQGVDPEYVWHDGLSYVFVTFDLTKPDRLPTLLRYDGSLTALDTTGTALEHDYEPTNVSYAAAHAAPGHSAVAYTAPDPLRFGVTIKVNFVTNDGSAATGGGSGGTSAGGASGASTGGADTGGGASTTGGTSGASTGGGGASAGGTSGASAGGTSGASPTGGSGTAGSSPISGAAGDTESLAGEGGASDGGNAGGASVAGNSNTAGTGHAGAGHAGASSATAGDAGASAIDPEVSTGTNSGCGCRTAPSGSNHAWLVVTLGLLQAMRMRRRKREQAAALVS